MARVKKKKRMTAKEIREKAEIKKRLQEEGILQTDKPRLDRKRFVEEAERQFLEWNSWSMCSYLTWGLLEMLEKKDRSGRYSLEAVGAAKAIRLAIERAAFEKEKREAGKSAYTASELYERVKDIYDA